MSLEKKTSYQIWADSEQIKNNCRLQDINIVDEEMEKVWVSQESLIKALDCMDMTMEDLEFEENMK